jgi:REP element-mobilizing transposase RayT
LKGKAVAIHELPLHFIGQMNTQRQSRRSIRLKDYDYSQPGGYFLTLVTFQREHLFGEITNGEMHLNEAGRIVRDVWEKLPERYPNVTLDEMVIMPNHFHGNVFITDDDPESVGAVHEPPVPVQGEPPVPVQGEPPVPVQGEPPVPVQGEPPVPVQGEPPVPVQGEPPVPVQGEPPVPVQGEPPVPVQGEPPVPVQGEPPVSIQGEPPVPVQGEPPPRNYESPEEYRLRRRRMLLPKLVGYFKMNTAKAINLLLNSSGVPVWQRNYYEHIIWTQAELDRIRNYIVYNPQQWDQDDENR